MGDKNVKAFSTLAGGFCNSLFLLKEKNIHRLNVNSHSVKGIIAKILNV